MSHEATNHLPSPGPSESGVQAFHQAALDSGRFLIQQCNECRKHVYFPRESCTHCGSAKLDWVAPSGGGTVYAVTTVRRKPDAGGDYNVSLIDLDEGVRLMSRVTDLQPDAVRIGQRVRTHVQLTDGCGVVLVSAIEGGVA